jgi:hypothetical protein
MDVYVGSQSKKTAAILTMHDDQKIFHGNRDNFIDIIKTGNEQGLDVYVVTTKDLKLGQTNVLAYRYDINSEMWVQQWIPFPKIIYNRIPFRKYELQPEIQNLISSCLKNKSIRFYNPTFFNKWTLFEWLKKSKTTKRYIPTTQKFSRSLRFSPLLKKYPLLYLKPEKGKAGSGIMQVRKVTPSRVPYRLVVQIKKQCHTYKFSKLSTMRAKIQQIVEDEPYIVQQGIELSTSKKRPYDLRVLLQKNDKGRWTLTGIGARVAGNSSITTHVPRGGSIDDPMKLLVSSFGTVIGKKIYNRAKQAAFLIVRQIEKQCGHTLGEMSMDLGVDIGGSIWFFEANAKPMKFDEPEIREKSLKQTIHYFKYLGKSQRV